MESADTPLDEVRRWQEQGLKLRETLTTERVRLKARLVEIDEALGNLPAETPIEARVVHLDQVRELRGSTPEVIREILRLHPDGLAAGALIAAAASTKIKPSAELVHTTLYRLTKANAVTRSGPRGDQVYRLADPATVTISPARIATGRKKKKGARA